MRSAKVILIHQGDRGRPVEGPAAEGFGLIKALLPRGRRLQRHVLALELPQLSK